MSTTEPASTPSIRVVLFGRPDCHLCDVARELVAQVCDESGERWIEVDIDAPDASDPAGGGSAPDAYGDLVPVVEVDGVRQGYWRIDAKRLRQALAAGAARPDGAGVKPA